MEPSEGFPPIERSDARVLVLGSLPGAKSIEDQQYYAHPQNAFWSVMKDLFDISGNYDERCAGVLKNGIAIWDVLQSSVRPGSLDADIESDTARVNDFGRFFERHSEIELVVFNGKKSEQLYRKMVETNLRLRYRHRQLGLPSTSPAYAAMRYPVKLAHWRAALEFLLRTESGGTL